MTINQLYTSYHKIMEEGHAKFAVRLWGPDDWQETRRIYMEIIQNIDELTKVYKMESQKK